MHLPNFAFIHKYHSATFETFEFFIYTKKVDISHKTFLRNINKVNHWDEEAFIWTTFQFFLGKPNMINKTDRV